MSDQGPSIDEKTKNFLRSATAVIQSMVRGEHLFCTEEIREERKSICDSCERRDAMKNTCLECGCQLSMKIPFAASECPIQKWEMDSKTIEAEVLKRVQKD